MCNVCFVGLCLYLDTSHVLLVVHCTLQCTLYTEHCIVYIVLIKNALCVLCISVHCTLVHCAFNKGRYR